MADHIPECHYGEPVRGGHILHCICDRLRAHGERIRKETIATYEANWQANLTLIIRRTRQETLAEARDAVGALPLVTVFTGELALIRRPVALAAIDALRVEHE